MKKFINLIPVLALALVYAQSAKAQEVLVDVTKSYSNISKIEVSGGWLDVTYDGGNSSEVSVEAYLASNESNQDIVFVTIGDVLKISYQKENRNSSWNSRNKGYIKISGPKTMALDVQNSSGTIMVENVENPDTYLKVSSGKIAARKIDGSLRIKASSGSLEIEDVSGDVLAQVTSGSADIMNVGGDLDYKSTSGSLDAKNIDGETNVALTSGNARLSNLASLGSLKFTSGNIRAENAGLGSNTSFDGTSGNFRVQTYSDLKAFNFSLKASSGNLKVGGMRTGKTLEIENGSGPWIKGSISSGGITIEN